MINFFIYSLCSFLGWFIAGGAGTGKSHLITAIYQMAQRTLQCEGESPDERKVILAAPTGCAAFNIGASTLHSAFLGNCLLFSEQLC